MSRLFAVIGGGVSGMAAARLLAGAKRLSAGPPPGAPDPSGAPHPSGAPQSRRVVLFEAESRLGGKVLTGDAGEAAVDLGPDQFLRRDPAALRWCAELGLSDLLVEPAVRRAGVFSYGAARPLPGGLVLGIPLRPSEAVAGGAVSAAGCWRGELDRLLPGRPLTACDLGLEGGAQENGGADEERSAGAILRARLGDELVDRLADPLLGGINAGRLDMLSLGTIAPGVAAALVGHHDLLEPLSATYAPTPASASPFYGVAGGLGAMIERGTEELSRLGVLARRSTAVRSLERRDAGFGLELSNGELVEVDGVVLALPPRPAAALLGGLSAAAGRLLGSIASASVAVVTFGFTKGGGGQLPDLPAGWSGIVVPAVEGLLTTALTFLSAKWPWTARGSPLVFIRASCGRFGDGRHELLDDTDLVAALGRELAALTGITSAPAVCHVRRWPESFPQFAPGHRRRIGRLEEELTAHPGIAVAGALLGGIGIPACLSSGERAAAAVMSAVGS
ncbi:MAG: protoporphyrinogen oxidase [Acidimicrobiales bacterium]